MPVGKYDLTYLVTSLALFLLPFVSRMKIGKILEIERKLQETRRDAEEFKEDTRQMFAAYVGAAAIATGNTVYVYGTAAEGQTITEPEGDVSPQERQMSAIELKILNTLWNKQVNKFPDLKDRFTFRLNAAAPRFLEFREAGNRLMGMGLISETDIGQFFLIKEGLKYCKDHYKEFPADMWFEQSKLDPAKLDKAIKNII